MIWLDSESLYKEEEVGHNDDDGGDHLGRENGHVKVKEGVVSTNDHPHLKRKMKKKQII